MAYDYRQIEVPMVDPADLEKDGGAMISAQCTGVVVKGLTQYSGLIR